MIGGKGASASSVTTKDDSKKQADTTEVVHIKILDQEINADLATDAVCDIDLPDEKQPDFVPDPTDVGVPWIFKDAVDDDELSEDEDEKQQASASSKKAEIVVKSDAAAKADLAITTPAKVSIMSFASSGTIPYAPNKKPIAGTYSLCAIAIKWSNKTDINAAAMASAARSTGQIYHKISKGNIDMPITCKTVTVPFAYAKKNLNQAEKWAIKQVGGGFDTYAIMNSGLHGSHTGSDIMHMQGNLKRTWYHERGHADPFKFGHAGRGDSQYDDPYSFMGKFPCNNINGPQEYAAGWAGDYKTGLYNIPAGMTIDFPFEPRFTKTPNPGNVTGVLIPSNTSGRDMFLSTDPSKGQLLFTLRLLTPPDGKGTTLVKSFSNTAEYNGLKFEKVSQADNSSVMRISRPSL